jgi:flavin reductase (DIM6/NTAB) family NADH-FMN oxidoreductase RutF
MQHFTRSDIQLMEQRYRASFINSLGGFKSLILVGTTDNVEERNPDGTIGKGATNLATFNSLFHIGANPPLCGLIFRPDSVDRHTLSNIEKTGFYTVNHVHSDFYKKAHQASARYPKDVSEFDATGLTPYYVEGFHAPFVAESRVKFGLELREKHPLSINGTIMIIGEIKHVILPESAVQNDGFVDIEKAGTLTCSGLDSYHTTQRIARLTYAKTDSFPMEIK